MSSLQTFLKKPISFECQGSGKCCVSRGEYGYVYLTLKDRQQMAETLGLSLSAFTKKHCKKEHGEVFRLKNNTGSANCQFLDTNNRCEVYSGRPTQCRTWPFWPENMNAKTWKSEIATFCPGVGKGKPRDIKDIKKQLAEQEEAEREIFDPNFYEI